MMQPIVPEEVRHASRDAMRYLGRIPIVFLAPFLLGGCVEVTAPERPIEINLNINIRQEVVVSLREDVRELIERNPGVF
jgi:YnbE-like lipoprotein